MTVLIGPPHINHLSQRFDKANAIRERSHIMSAGGGMENLTKADVKIGGWEWGESSKLCQQTSEVYFLNYNEIIDT